MNYLVPNPGGPPSALALQRARDILAGVEPAYEVAQLVQAVADIAGKLHKEREVSFALGRERDELRARLAGRIITTA